VKIGRESRESDERILDWLRRRKRGETTEEISKRWGVNQSLVLKATKNVAIDDIEGGKARDYPWFLL
jgi:hypothetical protein